MFISIVMAAEAGGTSGGNPWDSFLMLGLFAVVFYFLLILILKVFFFVQRNTIGFH